MKKLITVFAITTLSFSLTSCNECFFAAILGYLYNDIGAGLACLQALKESQTELIANVDNAMHGAGPTDSSTDETESQQSNNQSAFSRIITSPIFTAGPSLSWLGGDKEDSEKFPAKPGFQLGAMWQVPVGNKINVEPGLLYANRGLGYKTEESGYYEPGVPGGSYSYSYSQNKRLHYLEVPVFVSGRIADGFELFGGPQVGFLLGAKVVNESNGETTSTEKGTDGFSKVDVGFAAGVRYNIPNTLFGISLAYYHGFTNLSSSTYGGYGYDEPKYFTNSARIGVCYAYHGKSNRKKSAATGPIGN